MQIESLPAQPYIAVRSEVTMETFRDVVDANFGKPFVGLAAAGASPAGAPFIRILRLDEQSEPAEIEMGVPVAEPVEPGEGLVAGEMPAGEYLVYVHLGPYRHEELDDLADAQRGISDYCEANGLLSGPDDSGWIPANAEYYEVGPPMEEDFTKWRTRMVRLVSS